MSIAFNFDIDKENIDIKKLPECFVNEGVKWDFYIKDKEQKAETVSFIFRLASKNEWEAKYLERSKCWIIREAMYL
jgi:hypothetical protein